MEGNSIAQRFEVSSMRVSCRLGSNMSIPSAKKIKSSSFPIFTIKWFGIWCYLALCGTACRAAWPVSSSLCGRPFPLDSAWSSWSSECFFLKKWKQKAFFFKKTKHQFIELFLPAALCLHPWWLCMAWQCSGEECTSSWAPSCSQRLWILQWRKICKDLTMSFDQSLYLPWQLSSPYNGK